VKINIENGKKETLIKGAVTPAALPGKDMVVANRYNNTDYGLSEYVIISGGKEAGTIKWKPYSTDQAVLCSNIQFTDDDHLVFNRNDDLVLYTISQKKEETICKGTIVGLSQDRSRVYFMTNYV
jgi:hypothetical protein